MVCMTGLSTFVLVILTKQSSPNIFVHLKNEVAIFTDIMIRMVMIYLLEQTMANEIYIYLDRLEIPKWKICIWLTSRLILE